MKLRGEVQTPSAGCYGDRCISNGSLFFPTLGIFLFFTLFSFYSRAPLLLYSSLLYRFVFIRENLSVIINAVITVESVRCLVVDYFAVYGF